MSADLIARLTLTVAVLERAEREGPGHFSRGECSALLLDVREAIAALRAERGAEGPRCRLCGDTESKHTKSPADWRTVPGCSKFTPPAASSGESEGGTRG